MTTVAQAQSLPYYELRSNRVADAQAWSAVAVLVGVTAACLVLNFSNVLRFVFPALSFVVAAFVFRLSKPLYVGLVLWLWFLTPFLRRLVDLRSGWEASNVLLLAPYLAAGISGIVLFTRFSTLSKPEGLPFACALAAILYGAAVGMTRFPVADVVPALLSWIIPVLFAFFIYENRQLYKEFRRAIERAFLYGVLLMGGYGVYQFFYLPEWDRYWMENVNLSSFGYYAPMQVRVFSTMNAPAPFAAVMMAGLLVLFVMPSKVRIPAAIVGFAALLLTMSRSSWLGLLAGAIWLFFQITNQQRMQMIVGVLACVLLFVGASYTPIVKDILSDRIHTFSDPGHDISYLERVKGHKKALEQILVEPFGEGLGSVENEHSVSGNEERIGPHDSSLLETLYSLGWFGTLLYLVALASIFARLFHHPEKSSPFGIVARTILVGFAAQFLLNSILLGVLGFVVWCFAAICLAEIRERKPDTFVQLEGAPVAVTS